MSNPNYIQAKHIPDQALVDLVDRLYNMPSLSMFLEDGKAKVTYSTGAHITDICKVWDNIPFKLIQEKLRKLEKAGRIAELGSNTYVVLHDSDVGHARVWNTTLGKYEDYTYRRYPQPGQLR